MEGLRILPCCYSAWCVAAYSILLLITKCFDDAMLPYKFDCPFKSRNPASGAEWSLLAVDFYSIPLSYSMIMTYAWLKFSPLLHCYCVPFFCFFFSEYKSSGHVFYAQSQFHRVAEEVRRSNLALHRSLNQLYLTPHSLHFSGAANIANSWTLWWVFISIGSFFTLHSVDLVFSSIASSKLPLPSDYGFQNCVFDFFSPICVDFEIMVLKYIYYPFGVEVSHTFALYITLAG